MIYTFIAERCSDLPVSTCCRVMGVSTSGFYQRRAQPVTDTELAEACAANEVFDIWKMSRHSYGAPRVGCLGGSGAGRVGGGAGVEHLAGVDLDEEQDVVAAQQRGVDRQEVARDRSLRLQELAPGQGGAVRRGFNTAVGEDLPDSGPWRWCGRAGRGRPRSDRRTSNDAGLTVGPHLQLSSQPHLCRWPAPSVLNGCGSYIWRSG